MNDMFTGARGGFASIVETEEKYEEMEDKAFSKTGEAMESG